MSKINKYGLLAAAVSLLSALNVSADISADFNAYTAPYTVSSNLNSSGQVYDHVVLQDSASAGAFTVWGDTGLSGSWYSVRVLGDNTGSNYLNLNDNRVSGNPVVQVSTTDTYALNNSWGISTTFSVNAAQNGKLAIGLFGDVMDANGTYTLDQVASSTSTDSAAALQFQVTGGTMYVIRTGSDNLQDSWNSGSGVWVDGSAGVAAYGFDTTGATQYQLDLSSDGTDLTVLLTDGSGEVFNISTAIADLGSNIGSDVRFSAGDLMRNSTYGWDIDIIDLKVVPEPATIGLFGIAAFIILLVRKIRA